MRPRKTPRDTASTLPLSPRYAGKRSSPQPGGPIHISSTHPSTEPGQLQGDDCGGVVWSFIRPPIDMVSL